MGKRIWTNDLFWSLLKEGNDSQSARTVSSLTFTGATSKPYISVSPRGTAVDLAESAFSIYPNPAQDEVTISIDDLTSDAKATILDMRGRVLGEYTLSATTGKATVDVSALVDGVYMVRIVSKDINRVERLIVKR